MNTQLQIGNVSSSPATVRVFIGGQEMSGSPFTLAAKTSVKKSFAGIDKGPVKILSTQSIVAAARVIYKTAGGTPTSFSELMALPNSQRNTTFWLPWYNNVGMYSELRFVVP
jgi:hypothetical protein